MAAKKLTAGQERFAQEYLVDHNGLRAYLRAGYKVNEATARTNAARMLSNALVSARVQELVTLQAERTAITADNALKLIWARATADPRELVEVRLGCCRHCHGTGFGYQRTGREMERDRAKWVAQENDPAAFDEQGGLGFKAIALPHPDCVMCGGEGEPRVVLKDSATFSPAAASLFAGAKMGKHGLEIQLHDQGKHIELIGRHLKLFTDKIEVEVGDALAASLKEARERIAKQR